MITIESHMECDEVWVIDNEGNQEDVQMLVYDDKVVLSQNISNDTDQCDVLVLSPEQLNKIVLAFSLEEGVYDDEQVIRH